MLRGLLALLYSALGLLLVAGVLVGAGGVAGATSSYINIASSGEPPLPINGTGTSGALAGTLTVTLGSSCTISSSGVALSLSAYVRESTGSTDSVRWGSSTKVKSYSGVSVESYTVEPSDFVIRLESKTTADATIVVSTIRYVDTTHSPGTVYVSGGCDRHTATVANATFYTSPTAPSVTLSASGSPSQIEAGDIDATAQTWSLTLRGTETGPNGWVNGDVAKIAVEPPGGAGCEAGSSISFSSSPTVTVESHSDVSNSPTLSETLSSTCGGGDGQNELVLTFQDTGVFDKPTQGTVAIKITGVRFTVGSTAAGVGTGDVRVDASFVEVTSSSATVTEVTGAVNAVVVAGPSTTGGGGGGAAGGTGGTSGSPVLTANTPPLTVLPGAQGTVISPVSIAESSAGQVRAGYVCVTLASGSFDTSVQPAVAVSKGNGEVKATVSFDGEDGGASPTVEFQVTRASTAPSTYVLSNLAVDAPDGVGAVEVKVTDGTSANCSDDISDIGTAQAFSVGGTPLTRIYGATADATAAAELERQYVATNTRCPGTQNSRPVVLSTDAGFSDALTSSYLESTLRTGVLLTTPTALSSAAQDAIELEGITNVYLVGGPLAVSTKVVDQLEALPVDACGGGAASASGGDDHIQVTRIYGETLYETAEWVAEYAPATDVGSVDLGGAYAGTNQTGGAGRYNATAGSASSGPASEGSLPTAILATGRTFQDAEAASALSYADHLPILLTTSSKLSAPAASALSDLGVKQVIVMGGPDAVSDAVVGSLEGLGVSVLRVAGRTYSQTAVELADLELASSAAAVGLGWAPTGGVTVARGDYYSDGIAGAVVAADAQPASATATPHPEPLMLTTDPTTVGPYLTAFLLDAGAKGVDGTGEAKVDSLTVLGGPAAVTATIVDAMLADL